MTVSTTEIERTNVFPIVARVTSLDRGIKHTDRVETLHQKNVTSSPISVRVHTWQISRIIRRDFYLVATYIFYAKYRNVKNIGNSLQRLSEQAEYLEDIARKYDVPLDIELSEVIDLQIISDEADTLLDILMRADRACSRLLSTDMGEVLSDNFAPFCAEFTRLKQLVVPNIAKKSFKEIQPRQEE